MIEEVKTGIDIINYVQLAITIVSVGVVIIQYLIFQRWVDKRNKKLKSNLEIPLLLCEIKEANLARIQKVLIDFDFKIGTRSEDLKVLDSRNQKSIIVVGYADTPETPAKLKRIIDIASASKIPVVVYASLGSITRADSDIISSYSFTEVCNSDLRLTMTLTNICQYFDYDKPDYKTII